MRMLILLLSTSFLLFQQTSAQKNSSEKLKERWLISMDISAGFDLKPLQAGYPTDELIGYDSSPFNFYLSTTYFVDNHWGFNLMLIDNFRVRNSKRDKRFINSLNAYYGDEFYINSDTRYFSQTKYEDDVISYKILAGVCYKIKWEDFWIVPQLSLGNTKFYNCTGVALFKAKESNERYTVQFSDDDGGKKNLTISPAASVNYRLNKRFLLKAELRYFFMNSKIVFTEERQNQVTEESLTHRIDYQQAVHTLDGTIGIIFALL